jgi:hypothetical protein
MEVLGIEALDIQALDIEASGSSVENSIGSVASLEESCP